MALCESAKPNSADIKYTPTIYIIVEQIRYGMRDKVARMYPFVCINNIIALAYIHSRTHTHVYVYYYTEHYSQYCIYTFRTIRKHASKRSHVSACDFHFG